jgi:omega-amidase
VSGREYDTQRSASESIKMLSDVARETGVWLIGGSIPERGDDGKLYNTATVYSPKGSLVAIHRKVHLFDINIPGKITFEAGPSLFCMQSRCSYLSRRAKH